MLATLDNDLRGLLAIGFAGGLRRSEIVGLDRGPNQTEDGTGWIEIFGDSTPSNGVESQSADGGEASLRATGDGGLLLTVNGRTGWREVEIGRGSSSLTGPVAMLETWLRLGQISHGPVFRPVAHKNGGVSAERLSDKHVARLVQKTALARPDSRRSQRGRTKTGLRRPFSPRRPRELRADRGSPCVKSTSVRPPPK